jgi:tol-pal system protein YbgF
MKTFPLRQALLAACLAVTAMTAAMPAQAGLFDDDEARKAILDIRNQIDQLRQQSATKAELSTQIEQLRRSIFDLNNQLETIRADIAGLRGQGEVSGQNLARDVAEFQRRQRDALAALDDRLRKLEPQKVSLDGQEVNVSADEKQAYDSAIMTLRQGDFAGAVAALQAFQRRFPNSSYSGHATYWLGNAQYGKGDVKEALASFRSLVQASPNHPRAPEAMLSIANCQAELKDVKGARKTLDDLLKTYPQSEAAKAGRERLAVLK